MQKGVVKFFNDEKGFGFIVDDETGEELFVHASNVASKKIEKDNRVEYKLAHGKKGIMAIDVKKV